MREYDNLFLTVANHVAYVTIHHPPANVLSTEIVASLSQCIDDLSERQDVKAIAITGQGKFFAAGADIKQFQTAFGDSQRGKEMSVQAQRCFDKIESCRKPVIAAINGACLGGGLELALSCHLRIASHEAIMGLPELKLGLIPGFGGTQRLARATNKAKALELILTSSFIKGQEAERIGLVNRSVEPEELKDTVKALCETIANEKSAITTAFVLQAVTEGMEIGLQDGLELEAELFAKLFETEDMKEGVAAFIEKRAAKFRDK